MSLVPCRRSVSCLASCEPLGITPLGLVPVSVTCLMISPLAGFRLCRVPSDDSQRFPILPRSVVRDPTHFGWGEP